MAAYSISEAKFRVPIVLAGDIGGTNTRLALVERKNSKTLNVLHKSVYASKDIIKLEDVVEEFISKNLAPDLSLSGASFGIAGPVSNGVCRATNLPWVVEEHKLAKILNLKTAVLMNDLEVNAHGISALGATDLIQIYPGDKDQDTGKRGNQAILSAGTGLGEAGLFWDGKKHVPFACEGGHCDFSPTDELQVELWRFLSRRWSHVSWERVLSGQGILNIYEFFRDHKKENEPDWLKKEMQDAKHAAQVISRVAEESRAPIATKTIDLFIYNYGVEAGNLALKMMALGGLYLGGGISSKLGKAISGNAGFLKGFFSKGRLESLLRQIPVFVVLNEDTALLGAGLHALAGVE